MDPFRRRRRLHRHHTLQTLSHIDTNMFGHNVIVNIIFKLTGNPRMLDILLNEKGEIGRDRYNTIWLVGLEISTYVECSA